MKMNRTRKGAALLFAIAFCHVAGFFLIYRYRAQSGAAHSDRLLFLMPVLMALLANTYTIVRFWFNRPGQAKFGIAFLYAIPLTFLSFWAALIVAFNEYGT